MRANQSIAVTPTIPHPNTNRPPFVRKYNMRFSGQTIGATDDLGLTITE